MKFEYALIGIMIFLIGSILALIAVDSGQLKGTPSIEILEPKINIESELITNYDKIPGTNQLRLFGRVGDLLKDVPITISISNEFSEIIFVAQTFPDNLGKFSHDVIMEGPLWENSASFTVNTMYQIPTLYRESGVANLDDKP